jgi:hypothetical protein
MEMVYRKMRDKKRGMVWPELAWWAIGLAVLAILAMTIVVLRGEGSGMIGYIKDLFGWR